MADSTFDASLVPDGVPLDWAQDFLTRNPGDYSRLTSAYAPTSDRQYDSQGPAYNQTTDQLNPGYGGTTATSGTVGGTTAGTSAPSSDTSA